MVTIVAIAIGAIVVAAAQRADGVIVPAGAS